MPGSRPRNIRADHVIGEVLAPDRIVHLAHIPATRIRRGPIVTTTNQLHEQIAQRITVRHKDTVGVVLVLTLHCQVEHRCAAGRDVGPDHTHGNRYVPWRTG